MMILCATACGLKQLVNVAQLCSAAATIAAKDAQSKKQI